MDLASAIKDFAREHLPARLVYRLQLLNAVRKARRETARTAHLPRRTHSLSTRLIVSLTSFAPRFSTLHLTLESLLNQTLQPDAIILWIAEQEFHLLPGRVRALEARGLTIRECPDIRSYKKLIYALEEYPNAVIATADDDMFFPRTWLKTLVDGVEPGERVIPCYRAHRINVGQDGQIAPYLRWDMDVQDERARIPSVDILPTTGHGVLYPPGCFAPEVRDRKLFQKLAPTGDDLWFFWMSRRAGWKYKKVGGRAQWIDWPSSRTADLKQENWAGANDRQIRSLEASYGSPLHDV